MFVGHTDYPQVWFLWGAYPTMVVYYYMILYLLGFLACALVIFVAAKITYKQVLNISEIFNVPTFLVSLLLVAFSTSTPELFVGVSSALRDVPSFSLGNIFGSNIINLTFVAGIVILLSKKPLNLHENISLRRIMLTFAIASTPVFLVLDGTVSRIDGFILLSLYIFYIYWVLKRHKEDTAKIKQLRERDIGKATKSIFLFSLGIILLVGGSEAIITIAERASAVFSITPFVMGVFAIAFSTCLPEIMFGIRVALEQKPELSAGDLIGSSAVNAAGILGIVAIISPITPNVLSTVLLTGFFGIFVFLLYFLSSVKTEIPRVWGVWLLVLYFVFVSFNFILHSGPSSAIM